MLNVFHIPEKTKYVFVADLFAEDYTGGAELTLEAIIQSCDKEYYKIHSTSVTETLIEKNKDKYWIFGNFAHVPQSILAQLVRSSVKYSIIECDYKFCSFRSIHLHKLQKQTDCDCHTQQNGKFIRALYLKAHKVFFMSEKQMDVYKNLWPSITSDNFVVLSSIFSAETLSTIQILRNARNVRGHNGKFAILKGGSWIKAEKETVSWAVENNIQYDLIGGLKPDLFLNELAKYRGLIFFPAGHDTCPRLVIEAKLLGLDTYLNDNVQHRDEKWFTSDINTCEEYLKTRTVYFWNTIQ